MICAACPREARGFRWIDLKAAKSKRTIFHACSMACLDTIAESKGDMNNPSKSEVDSMYAACEAAAEYLETLGKTELSEFTEDERMQFIDAVVTGFCDAMKRKTGFSLRENEMVPF